MTRFVFLHAADLHLDTPFVGLGSVAPSVAEALRDASLAAWDALVDLALERRAAFVVLAGDIYDGPERGVRAQLRFRRGLERLSAAGTWTFVAHGNHDPVESSWSAIRTWPERVRVFDPGEPRSHPIEVNGSRVATVHGISYARREARENLARLFERGPELGVHVGVLHTNCGNDPAHASYAPCTLDDLAAAQIDYWALGHIHERRVLSREPWVVYPGNLQGRTVLEQGAKGALVVAVEDGQIREPEFVALDRVRFVRANVDATSLEDLPAVVEALETEAQRLRDENQGRGLVVRGSLRGRTPSHAALLRPGSVADVLNTLRDRFARVEPFVWWESVMDATRAPLDLDVIRGRHDFSTELLARAERFGSDASELAKAIDGVKLAEGARRVLDTLGPIDAKAVLDDALELALSKLEEETK